MQTTFSQAHTIDVSEFTITCQLAQEDNISRYIVDVIYLLHFELLAYLYCTEFVKISNELPHFLDLDDSPRINRE